MRTLELKTRSPYQYTSFNYDGGCAVIERNGPTLENTIMEKNTVVYVVVDSEINTPIDGYEHSVAVNAARSAVAYTRHTGRATHCLVCCPSNLEETQKINTLVQYMSMV